MESQIINNVTDWWMFGATIGAGILTALVTIITVFYTNKWTAERYEKDKIYQNQKAARRLTWNDDQLEKLAEYRDKLMGKEK